MQCGWSNISDVTAIYLWGTDLEQPLISGECLCLRCCYSLSVNELFCMINFRFQQNVNLCEVVWTSVPRKTHNTWNQLWGVDTIRGGLNGSSLCNVKML